MAEDPEEGAVWYKRPPPASNKRSFGTQQFFGSSFPTHAVKNQYRCFLLAHFATVWFLFPVWCNPTICYILLPKPFASPPFYGLIIADRAEVEKSITLFKEPRSAAALKEAKTRADRLNRQHSPPALFLLAKCKRYVPSFQRKANILDIGEGKIRHRNDDAREADKREKQQQQRYEKERTRALEKQRMENELWAGVEEREQ